MHRSRPRLFIVGILMLATVAAPAVFPVLWVPGILLLLAGICLVVWATLGRGQ